MTPHPKWDKEIKAGLYQKGEEVLGNRIDFNTQGIYASLNNIFVGGILFEIHSDILWIDSIWVKPSFRNKELGKTLLQQAILFATQHEIKQLQLNTYFKEAHIFFLSCGFEDVAIIPFWKYGLDCYLMRKVL